jgi:hypothetical protein
MTVSAALPEVVAMNHPKLIRLELAEGGMLMSIEELRSLKGAFLKEYDHFADRRIKNIDKGSRFIIDDRETAPSFGAGNIPYGWFCQIFADVDSPDAIQVTLYGELPLGPSVNEWIACNDVSEANTRVAMGATRKFTVRPTELNKLLSLAVALQALVTKGTIRRPNSDYHVCPRMAACLLRVHSVLARHWSA